MYCNFIGVTSRKIYIEVFSCGIMKIAAVLHHVGRETPLLFLKRLEEALSTGAEIVIGPDYSLNYDLSRPNTRKEKDDIFRRIMRVSSGSRAILVPGTISYPIEKEMLHVAPAFFEGVHIFSFQKERDNGESKLAESAGLTFRRGDSSQNRFGFGGKNLAVEICGDHGTQDIRECDVELILAYDQNAGFCPNASNDSVRRKAVVCDGYKPFASAFDYDPNAQGAKLVSLPGRDIALKSGKVRLFEV
jgi:predicted amidohydrolase